MKSTGFIKKIDRIGRFKFPQLLLTKLEIKPDDLLVIYKDAESIVIEKYEESCIFCEETANIVDIRGKKVCPSCLKEIKKLKN